MNLPKINQIQSLVPWAGLFFWVALWLWLMFAKAGDTAVKPLGTREGFKPPEVQLQGFSVRYMTRYSDFKTTWLELAAEKGRSLEDDTNRQILEDVTVRVVIKNDALPDETGDLSDLSKQLGIDWLHIQSATGLYTFDDRGTIELHGNVQVFGYHRDGTMNEWIAADTLIYDQDRGIVRSVGPAFYDGSSSIPVKPCIAQIETTLDLSSIEVDFVESLNPSTFKSPLRDPSMRPVYDPPSALKFLNAPTNP